MSKVKYGDTHDVIFTVKDVYRRPVDLTGATTRILAQPVAGGSLQVLESSLGVKKGTVVHSLTGTLPVGVYRIEVELTNAGVVTTAPSSGYGTLDVVADLG